MNTYSAFLVYLKTTQLSNGSFENSPFQTSLILICLDSLKNNKAVKAIADKAIPYLLSQSTLKGTWNYWDRSHPKSETLPDDLDDTAMTLAAISIHDPELITEETLLSFVNNLIAHETREGGPYFTWIVPPHLRESWDDVDVVVNSTINFFLNQQKIFLEPLDTFLENAITHQSLQSKYYNKLHHCFFLSRNCSSRLKKDLMKLLVQTYPSITTLLDRALFIITYLNLDGNPQKISHDIDRLLKTKPEHLHADPFYIEEISSSIATHAGSQALTAAYIIQALKHYEHAISTRATHAQNHFPRLINQISRLAVKHFSDTHHLLQKDLQMLLDKMSLQNKAVEIFLLPLLWHTSLRLNDQKYFSQKQVFELCVANVLGWIGFGIYDDVIDGEQKQHLIPLANVCVRKVFEIFQKITPPDHLNMISVTLNTIDAANAWEQAFCRIPVTDNVLELPKVLPDYEKIEHLASKSLGHGLGPMILTLPKKDEVQQFFTHYLIARQLNDDAHDWLKDLEQGIINPVSVQIIKRFRELHPSSLHINLETDRELLQEIFWNETIEDIIHHLQKRIAHAESLGTQFFSTNTPLVIRLLLDPLKVSIDQAITERSTVIHFIEKYTP